jgi:hypothetical protein
MGKDIGILPGGWVAVGNDMIAGYKIGHVLLRCGPGGTPGDRTDQPPQILSLAKISGIGIVSNYVNREIPVWDDSEVLTHGDGVKQGSPPALYRGFAEALNKEGDAHPLNGADYGKYTVSASEAKNAVHFVTLSVPNDQHRPVLPDKMGRDIESRRFQVYGTMLLAGNAVVLTGHGASQVTDLKNGRMPNTGDWQVIALNRKDRSILFEIMLPDAPAPSGMSLTRDGDALIPLVDGRLVCVGGGAEERPLPAVEETATAPGLSAKGYASDVESVQYHSWSSEDLAIMKPVRTWVATELNLKAEKADDQRIVSLQGFVEAPETGKYRFHGKSAKGARDHFELLDQTGHFVERAFPLSEWGGRSVEVFLAKGKHPICITIIQGSVGKELTMQWEGPGITKADVPAAALSQSAGAREVIMEPDPSPVISGHLCWSYCVMSLYF